jgi:hypothetical protein
MYNFHKIRETNSESYFHHECFDKDNKSAMSEIKRKPEKKKRKNMEDDEEDVPCGNSEDSIPLKHKKSMRAEMPETSKDPKQYRIDTKQPSGLEEKLRVESE